MGQNENENITDFLNNLLVKEFIRLSNNKAKCDESYWVTFTAEEDGTFHHDIQTIWCAFTKTKPIREIREGRIFYSELQKEWINDKLNVPCLVINDVEDLYLFFLLGGHALIAKELGAKYLTSLVEPSECLKNSSHFGFFDLKNLPKDKRQHAPTKKLRMKMIQRDNYRCRICGRSPAEYTDVELHVHHIIPWGVGGITEEENLITICKTCHDGLEPHYSPLLSNLQTSPVSLLKHMNIRDEEYINGLINYQKNMYKILKRLEKDVTTNI